MEQFSASEVSRLAGFKKPWMLAHLEREKTFIRENFDDRRHGRQKKYTFTDLVVLRTINRMLNLGARPARIKDVINKISKLSALSSPEKAYNILVKSLGTKLFITQSEAYLVDGPAVHDLLTSGQPSFSFMVGLEDFDGQIANVIVAYIRDRSKLWKVDCELLEELCQGANL